MALFQAAVLGTLLLPSTCPSAAEPQPKRIMVLHSFGPNFKPWSEYEKSIRAELEQRSPWPLDITEHSLVAARFADDNPDGPLAEYLRSLYLKHPNDLIISIGAPAAAFIQRHRDEVFAGTPMILTAIEQRLVRFTSLTENDTVIAEKFNLPAVIENILRVLPDTKNVTVVIGTSPLEKFWLEEIRNEFQPFEGRVAFTWTNALSFEEVLKQAAALPSHSAIFWALMAIDAAGVVHQGDQALAKLHTVTSAPIFSYDDAYFGSELVGGPMHAVSDTGQRTAAVAIRILGGEKVSEIKTPAIEVASPKYDWREMQRWGISKDRLPPGSDIQFRPPDIWQLYRPQILAACAIILLQAVLVGALIYEHRRRHLAEVQSRNSMAELTQMNRIATAGELSAAITHEVKQPLTGIVTMANAALRWLSRETPDIGRARDALNKVVAAGHNASEVITNVRGLFGKDTQEKTPTDINKLIRTVLGLLYIDLRKYSIETQVNLSEQLPPIIGNAIQLQQVILNLVMNAIESMHSVEPRVLSIKSETTEHDSACVSIADSGSGIDIASLSRIFQPMFTTKARGMGMGLSICKSIIEAHNGKIWVSANSPRGSIFHFEVPLYSGDKCKSDLGGPTRATPSEALASATSLADEPVE
jgi:signal transduction histidine kinase